MKTLAHWLRELADRLDPLPAGPDYTDLLEIDGVTAARFMAQTGPELGRPIAFWPIGHNGLRVWPRPDRDYQLAIRETDV